MNPFWTEIPEQWLGNAIYSNYATETHEQDFQVLFQGAETHDTLGLVSESFVCCLSFSHFAIVHGALSWQNEIIVASWPALAAVHPVNPDKR